MLLEICVDDAVGLAAAIAGGADRIELCSALDLGGLTPSAGLIALAAKAAVPVRAMVRPREGDFDFADADIEVMLSDIATIRAAGIAGVVLGASRHDGRLDLEKLRILVAAAQGMAMTLHRAIDLVPDMAEAVEQAIELGFDTILTSGRAPRAPDGAAVLAEAHRAAAGRIAIMAGAGVTADSAPALLQQVTLDALHGSCSDPVAIANISATRLGFERPGRRVTSAAKVAALKAVIAER